MRATAEDPLIGRTIAQRYRLISRLGAGSVASVYLARHVLIDRLSAIKIVHAELANDPLWRERFLREARAVNRINHPNIVEISDVGEADGLLFLVMEYVPGESLEQALARGPIGWRRAAALGVHIASALGRAHQMDVIHRGLDPSSVLLVPRRDGADLVKLTDFGVAKLADAAPLTERAVRPRSIAAYAAPDKESLHDLDARSDLFALGVVLYQAVAGTLPAAPPERLPAIAPDTPPFFDEVVATLLAPDPEARPRDGFEAADLLQRALAADPPSLVASAPAPPAPSGRVTPIPLSPLPLTMRYTPIPPSGGSAGGVARAPIDKLAPICTERLAALEENLDVGARPLDERARTAVAEARKLCAMVGAVSELVASDNRTLEAVRARGRDAQAELGRRLDEAARERSKALGWAGTIAERSYQVEARRLSGEHPVPAIDAMVWEQAALEQEEDRARERAARLAADMHACQAEMDRQGERLEHELLVVDACLEGRIAALRALSVEAWAALEDAAVHTGAPPSAS